MDPTNRILILLSFFFLLWQILSNKVGELSLFFLQLRNRRTVDLRLDFVQEEDSLEFAVQKSERPCQFAQYRKLLITLAVLKQTFKNMHDWFIDTDKMKLRFALYKAAVALELIKDTKKLNVSLAHSNCKDLANLQEPARGCVSFISRLFACSRLSLCF